MLRLITAAFAEFTERFGRAWNQFWFTPAGTYPLAVLRVCVGVAALAYVGSHTADLVRWFGPNGLLPADDVGRLITGELTGSSDHFHWTYLGWFRTPAELWTVHALGLMVLAFFTVGVFPRITSVLAFIVVLSYTHRAPMIIGQFEPVLTMLLFYLCFAPSGNYLSVTKWWANRKNPPPAFFSAEAKKSWVANVCLRLIQVHLSWLYLFMGLTKLGGVLGEPNEAVWWRGYAIWTLIARSESRLVDLTWLHNQTFLWNAWTHGIVLFELAFAILIWSRTARPLLLLAAVVSWFSLALVTGLISFCVMMLVANLAFVSSETFAACCQPSNRRIVNIPAKA